MSTEELRAGCMSTFIALDTQRIRIRMIVPNRIHSSSDELKLSEPNPADLTTRTRT